MEDNKTDKKQKETCGTHPVQQQVSPEILKDVIGKLATTFQSEREKTEPYKEMFKAGSSYTGLLRQVEHGCIRIALDAYSVFEKQSGRKGNNELLSFLLAVPYLSRILEQQIEEEEGMACCVDKAFFVLSEHMRKIVGG